MPSIVLTDFDPEHERRRESLTALGNGLLVVRGCPADAAEDEGHYPATYRAGLYDCQASEVEGQRVSNTSIVRLPDWRGVSFRIEGSEDWLSVATAKVVEYRLELDLTQAVSRRDVLLEDGAGRRTRLVEQRLVSMAEPNRAALRLELTPQNWSGRVEVRSLIDGDVVNDNVRRFRPYARRHLEPLATDEPKPGILRLRARTLQSRIELAVAAQTRIEGAAPLERRVHAEPARIWETFGCDAEKGRTTAIEKSAAIFTLQDLTVSDPADSVLQALQDGADFETLRGPHAGAWARLWARLGLEAEQEELERAAHFHAFHLLKTYSPHSSNFDLGFPARGWQEAYHGQIFWDEIFVFPFLNLRYPEFARAILLYRYRRLAEAKRGARQAGYAGAMFPWRSARTGEEETPTFQYNLLSHRWMRDDTRLQRHIGSAIAYNVWRYVLATDDIEFLSEYGAELLVEIARFWASIATFDARSGRYEIKGVVGPDEYHTAYPGAATPGLDNNAYTNVMAVWTLCRAREALKMLPVLRRKELTVFLGVTDDELDRWDEISRRMRLCFHDDGALCQFEGFDKLLPLDWRALQDEHDQRVDWLLEARGDDVNRYQVSKQADVLMLLHLLTPQELGEIGERLGYRLGPVELRRTADYYLKRITHESSLSRVVCAGALARLEPSESWRYFERALKTDLDPPPGSNTEEGVHLGAMAGTLDVLQRHYLGLDPGERLAIDPAPPAELGPVKIAFQYRGCALELDWRDGRMCIRSDADNRAEVSILHAGTTRPLAPGQEQAFEVALGAAPDRGATRERSNYATG
jgi:alpha,alpha-trehalase